MAFTSANFTPTDVEPLDIIHPVTDNPQVPGLVDYITSLQLQPIVQSLLNPRSQNIPATLKRNGQAFDADELAQLCAQDLSDDVEQSERDELSDLMQQLTINSRSNHGMGFKHVAFSQALTRCKLPAPSYAVQYSVDIDVIPAAKTLLQQQRSASAWDSFFVALAGTFKPSAYVCAFVDEASFDGFKQFFQQLTSAATNNLDANTRKQIANFNNVDFNDLTCALTLRDDRSQLTDEYSFARLLIYALNQYLKQQKSSTNPDAWLIPYDINAMTCPEAVICVNVEKHAVSPSKTISAHWKKLIDALDGNRAPVSLNAINKLTAGIDIQQNLRDDQLVAQKQKRIKERAEKRNLVQLIADKRPNSMSLKRDIDMIMKRMGRAQHSHNTYTVKTFTRSKSSKRRPDNPDSRGKRKTKIHYPDLHIYADCSGSISNEDLQHSFMTIATLAAQRGCDIYFTSFSHEISEDTFIKTKGKSPQHILNLLNAIPKVTGGTLFDVVWDHINESPTRQQRLNLVITDFDFRPRYGTVHSPNTYYTACESNYLGWDMFKQLSEDFVDSMKAYDPAIDMKLLGMR